MGLFSSKTIITTGTSISPLLTQEPNLVRDAVNRAIVNDWPKTPVILDALVSGYNVNPREYYRFGETDYIWGLPTGEGYSLEINEQTVSYYAEKDYSGIRGDKTFSTVQSSIKLETISLSDATYRVLYSIHAMNRTVDYNQGFGRLVSQLSLFGYSYNDDAVFFDSFGSLDYSAQSLTVNLYRVDPDTGANRVDFQHTYYSNELLDALGMVNLTNKVYRAEVTVTATTDTGTYDFPHYFVYDPATNDIPALPYYSGDGSNVPYYPIAYVRKNNAFLPNTAQGQEQRENINKLLKSLAIELEPIEEALADNPDLDKIEHSFITLAFPIGRNHTIGNSSDTTSRRDILAKYMYLYGEFLDSVSTVTRQEFTGSINTGIIPKLNMTRVTDGEVRTDVYWSFVEVLSNYTAYRSDRNYEVWTTIGTENPDRPRDDNFFSSSEMHCIRHNHDTRTTTTYWIRGLFTVSGVYPGKDVITTLYDVIRTPVDENDYTPDGFFLPLHQGTMDRLSKQEYTYVAWKSTILVSYAIDKTKVKWYQRSGFLKLIRIVAFIASVVTMNPSIGAAASQIATQIAILILEQVLITLLIAPLMSFALKEIAELIGGDLGEIVAIIALAVAAAYGLNMAFDIPFADVVIKATTELTDIAQSNLRQDMLEFQEEVNSYKAEYVEMMREINEAKNLLGDTGINPLYFNGLNGTLAVETPNSYFTRTLNTDANTSLEFLNGYYSNNLYLGA